MKIHHRLKVMVLNAHCFVLMGNWFHCFFLPDSDGTIRADLVMNNYVLASVMASNIVDGLYYL